MKPLFKDKITLLYTDTDSLYFRIEWPTDPIDYIAEKEAELKLGVFDLSQTAKYRDSPLKNKLGCFKYEGACNKKGEPGMDYEIVEAVFATTKSYMKVLATPTGGEKVSIAQKGVPSKAMAKKFRKIELYKQGVFTTQSQSIDFNQMRSFNHVIAHCKTTKIALSAENEKVFQVSPYESRPHGHWRNKEPLPLCEEWDLSESDDEAFAITQGSEPRSEGLDDDADDDAVEDFLEDLRAPSDADSEWDLE